MPDMIFVSMEDWDDMWRRNQFLVSRFSAEFPGSQILFVGLPRNFSHAVRRGDLSAIRATAVRKAPGLENVHIHKPWKWMPDSVAPCRHANEAMFRSSVRRLSARLGMHKPVLWLNPHYAVHMVGKMDESRTIYDVTDDWTEITQSPALRARTCRQDAALCRAADHVIVCSEGLYRSKAPLSRSVHLVPNGVNADHYRCVLDGSGPLPALFDDLPRPVLGYTGTIHPDRVDVALVEAIAKRIAGSVVLVGVNMLSREDTQRLSSLPNVRIFGPVAYSQVPQYMRGFDISITPHRVTAFTESLNPIKLWEYLAAGKPIISTPVAGFRDYAQHLYLADSADDFVAAAARAMAESPARCEARRTEALRHSWHARAAQILPLLQDPPAVAATARKDTLHAA